MQNNIQQNQTPDIIQIGKHYNRSMVDCTVLQYNTVTKTLETVMKPVAQEHIQMIRARSRQQGTPNLSVDAFLVHKVSDDISASYRITSNRFGINLVPWSLVSPEESRRDMPLISFETENKDRILTIAKDKTIVSACFQFADDDRFISDTTVARDPESPVSASIIEGTLYVFCSEKDYDLILMFSDLQNCDDDIMDKAQKIVSEFKQSRTFTI